MHVESVVKGLCFKNLDALALTVPSQRGATSIC